MKRKSTRKYFKKEWKEMQMHLEAYLKTRKQDDLHQFRVCVKKLQALLVLSDQDRHGKLTASFKPVKKVSSKAGELRNAHICEKLVQTQQDTGELVRQFKKLTRKSRKWTLKSRNTITDRLKKVKSKTIRSFYERELRRIASGLAGRPSAEELHDCRKRIKVLLYNYPLIHNELMFDMDTAYLDQLQKAIGDWHDQWITNTPGHEDPVAFRQLSQIFTIAR